MYQNTPQDQPKALRTGSELQDFTLSLESHQAQLRQAQIELQNSHFQVGKIREEIGQLQKWILSKEELPQGSLESETSREIQFPEGDYVSPGLVRVKLDRCFPSMVIGKTTDCSWPFLRRETPHNWYVDARYPLVGFINRDEVHILYNSALKFQGKRALEIGCWLGWSACHIASAGVELDVIDPMLEKPEFYESVSNSLKASGVLGSVRLIPGYSPEKVEELAAQENRKWSFIFIDGNHDAPGPLNDAKLCEQLAEEDALILFHDLIAPDVAAGLEYLAKKGWNVMIYQTMQVMGVAWRGEVEPVFHQPDPDIYWQIPQHLQPYAGNLGVQVNQDRLLLEQALKRHQAELDWLRLKLQSSQFQSEQVWEGKEWNAAELNKTRSELEQLRQNFEQAQIDLNLSQVELGKAQDESTQTQVQLQATQAALDLLQPRLAQSEAVLTHTQSKLLETQNEIEQMRSEVTQSSVELLSARSQLDNEVRSLEKAQERIAQLSDRIIAMESSKFWQIRKIWIKLKQSMGLRGD